MGTSGGRRGLGGSLQPSATDTPATLGPRGRPAAAPCATVRTAQLPQGQDEGTPSPPPPPDVQEDGIKGLQLGEGGGGSAGWHTTTPCTHRVAVARGPQPLGTWGALEPTVLPQGCPWDSQRASDQRRTEMSPTGCLQGTGSKQTKQTCHQRFLLFSPKSTAAQRAVEGPVPWWGTEWGQGQLGLDASPVGTPSVQAVFLLHPPLTFAPNCLLT